MEQDIQSLVDAIKGASEANYLKDYIFPLAIVLLAGFVAHYSTAYMRYLDFQKQKLDVANEWMIGLQGAFQTLVSIKQNYQGRLTDEPVDRATKIPEIISHNPPLVLPVYKLSFITQSVSNFQGQSTSVRNPAYIHGLQSNYNLILSTLEKRNLLASEIIPKIAAITETEGAVIDVSLAQIIEEVGQKEFIAYVELTEFLIKYTDELLIAIHNFLCLFPDVCKLTIDTQRIKHYGKLISCIYDHMDIFEKCPDVNIDSMAGLFHVSSEELEARLSTGYESQAGPIENTSAALKRERTVDDNIAKFKQDKIIRQTHRYWWR